MDKKNTKSKKPRLQLVISILVTSALFLSELYVMINQPANVILMVGIGVLVLIALYFVIDAMLDCSEEKEIANREQYDTIFRSEKASYTLLRKNLDEILKNVKESDKSENENQVEKIVNSQKAIAKVSMGKTKEGTESILAANKAVYNKVAELQELIGNNGIDSEENDRLFIELNNLEASINDRIQGLSEKLSGFQEEIERLADHIARINEDAIHEAVKTSSETRTTIEENYESIEDVLQDTFIEEPSVEETPETVIEPESIVEPEPVPEPIPEPTSEPPKAENPNAKMDQDDIAALIASMTGGDEEPAAEPEPIVEPEPEPIPEPPKADNPNAKMDQDDIAALIASMTGGDETPVAEPEPEPVVEEKPPMPDLSDPNKVMTPEEIAALLANM